MQPTSDDIGAVIARAKSAKRRRDAQTLVALMQQVSGRDGRAWGTIIGFGACHYRYPTGTEGNSPLLAFAPRASATTIYLLDGVDAHADALAVLGPHTTGAGCLYIRDLEMIDISVLESILHRSLAWIEAGGSEGMALTATD
ncbi:DUF1801 domain-containing protein [uncultured Microbacterium sp.]|uniref:DUF1801 domain-containing protein n=1 Tax=uncultured Microbacterium sp. TaxID=191216 RepID=UPI00260C2598|nr:DUF1801 domain-containing protein [uncultured Microbacterium sp.]